jgi:DNA-binding MarR family transcriptional regulator
LSRTEYIALRVVAQRAPVQSPAALDDFLAGQRQLGLDQSGVVWLVAGLEARGLITGGQPGRPGPIQLSGSGAALLSELAERVKAVTARLYADFDPDDLATAHRVLAEVTERANRLRHEL